MTYRCFEYVAVKIGGAMRFSLCLLAAFMAAGTVRAVETSPDSAQALAARNYTVQRGDTLDRLIRQTMGGSPLKIELLRKAFVDGNPQAFVFGNVSRLRAGVVLQVPDHTKLLRSTILPMIEGSEATSVTGEGRSSSSSDRRSWIRFP